MNLLLFLLLGCFWGGSFAAIKLVVAEVPPFAAAFTRVLLSLAFLSVILPLRGKPLSVPRTQLWKAWLLGLVLQGLPFSLLFWGETEVSAGLAGILNGTLAIWAFLLAAVFLRKHEPISAKSAAGIGLSMLGVVCIFAPKLGVGAASRELLATGAILLMAMSYAAGTVLNRALITGSAPSDLYGRLYQMHLSSLVYLGLAALVFEGNPLRPGLFLSRGPLLGVLYLSFFSTAIAWMIQFRLTRDWGAVSAATVNYMLPVVALGSDFLLFGTVPARSEALGAAAILGGMALVRPRVTPKSAS